jgi:hypothetical protein
MENLISTAILIATLFGGTFLAGRIHHAVREAALTKTAQGPPKLAPFAASLSKSGSLTPEENSRKRSRHSDPMNRSYSR